MTTPTKRQTLTLGLIAIGLVLGVPLDVKFAEDRAFPVKVNKTKGEK